MNKAKVTALLHKKALETGLSFNQLMIYFFLEEILKKLADGKYRDNFIFKGGFLLSNVVGIDNRCTVDIDFLISHSQFAEDNIRKMLCESLEDTDGDIQFKVDRFREIKDEDRYGGYRVSIICKLENIVQIVPLDIATGDVITPYPIDYPYKSVFTDEKIIIKSYTLETVIAEKLETIYARGLLNSRSKDYYDLYIIYTLKKSELDIDILKQSIKRTFEYRYTELDYTKIFNLFEALKNNDTFIDRWNSYKKKNSFVQVSFNEAISAAVELVGMIV